MRAIVFLVLLSLPECIRAQNGLTGQYYDTATFGTLKTTRTDATVEFNWGTAIPAGTAITQADTFSVAWSGQIEPEFSQLYTFHVTADDGARLWINDQLVVTRTYYAVPSEMCGQVALKAGQRVNIRLEYIEQSGSASVKLEWSSASRAREVIPENRLFPDRAGKAGGALMKEHWSGITGTTIAALTSHANYPEKPGGRELITSFECLAQGWSDSFGTRVTGFIVPPVTGSYTFAASGDDQVELYLSTDESAANRSLVASVTAWTGFRVWDAQPSQQSTAIPLVQGRRYYVELLHKEHTGGDHWSVAWMKPGDAEFSVIPGSALVQPGLDAAQPAQAALLNTMARDHPRIFATAERFARLRTQWQSANASQPKTWAQNAINNANTILTQAPVTYAPDVRGTILTESRKVVDRMYKLGLAWQLTGDSQYAERAWSELDTVAAFPDWHPPHFLDTAEMTHACAIGYDWFYSYWTQARRDTIRTAIINLGLNPGLSQYTSNVSWSRSTGNNWNMVCNGGLALGALAVGTEDEALTENILNRALNSTRPVWKHFTTDCGAWYEGPGYWGYTTEYGIRMFAGLEWVLGSDFGISGTQGVSESGLAPIEATGPTNIIYNFADAGAGGPSRGPVFQWMARRYGQPLYDWWNNQGGGGALDALWHNESVTSIQSSGTPPDMAFHGDADTAFKPQEMVTMRGRWNNSRTTFVGCKGGEMGAAHGNLDAGTFVLDALGKRWFHDLGGDNYALPGYFSSTPSTGTDRWDYYRMRPEGQNTLLINPSANADMVLNAVAPLISYQSEPGGANSLAIHDLTPVYSGMTRVWRGTRLTGARDEVLVQDEIQASTGKTVWWFGHFTHPTTSVTIDPDGTSAMMTQGAERLWCKIVSGGGTFQVMDAVPLPTSPNPAGQNANTGHKKLAIQLTDVTNTTLALWFVPLAAGEAVPATLPALVPLNTWNLAVSNDPPVAANGNGTIVDENAVDIDLRNHVTDDSTPPEQMRFSVGNAVNGTITLLADGHTARFIPVPGYTGAPVFSFTATDTSRDPREVLAYDFDLPDAGSSFIVPDVSGNGRNGTLDNVGTGAAILQDDVPAALGRDGRSLDLAENGGANAARLSRVLSANEVDFNSGDWTISGWFKRRDANNDDMVWHLNNGDGYGSGEEMYLMATGASSLTLHHYPGPDVSITGNSAIPGVWHHFAVVRDGTTISLYLNGILIGSDSAFTLAINQAQPLVFGGHTDKSATYAPRWFDGRLDELAVFNAALEPAAIETLAQGMTIRHFGGLSATGSVTLSAAPLSYTWSNAATNARLPWSAGANWEGAAVPVSSRGSAVRFFTGQTLAGGAVTSDHDLPGEFILNNLTLAGTTSASTITSITGGRLSFLNNGLQNPNVAVSATNGSGFTYDVSTPVTIGAHTTVSGSGSAVLRFSGSINGDGDLIKTSTGTLILAGSNTFTGDTIIHTGTLQVGDDGAMGSLGTGDVLNHATLRFDRTGTLRVPNSIGGGGGLYIDCPINAGTIVLEGANSFDGGVTVNSGALRISNSHALGDGTKTITLNNGTNGAPQLRLDGSLDSIDLPASISYYTSSNSGAVINEAGNNVIRGNFTLSSGGGNTKILVSSGSLLLEGNLMPNTTNRTLDLAGAGKGVITGNVSDGSATNVLAVAKSDSGTWTLAGTNTWTGNTSVNAGTLIMNGSLAAGGTTSIATAAKLAGAGNIAANTNVNGTLQPGDGIGAITFGGSLNFGSASHLAWELGANADTNPGVNFDKVNASTVAITNNAVIDLSLNRAASEVDLINPFWTQARTWPILDAASITGTFKLGTVSADATGRAASGYGVFTLQHSSTAIHLVWTPRPPIEQWRFTHFTTNANTGNAADLADIDGDGLVNLLEYAFGGNPNVSSMIPLPQCRVVDGKLSLTFTRTLSNTDITLIVQSSASPDGPWTNLAQSVNGSAFAALALGCDVFETGEENIRAVEVRDNYSIADPGHPRGFLRVSVTR